VYQTQLKARQQKTGENLQEFEAEIRCLVHLAYPAVPDEIQEELVAQYFVEGIGDPEVKKMLKIFKGSNSSELLVRALEVEAAWNDLKPETIQEERVPPADHAATLIYEIKSMFGQLVQQMAALGNGQFTQLERSRPITKVKCYQCGRKGHYSRNCRQRSCSPNPQYRRNQDIKTNHRNSSVKRNITCYNCGRKGHYRWNCRQQSRLPTPQNWRN